MTQRISSLDPWTPTTAALASASAVARADGAVATRRIHVDVRSRIGEAVYTALHDIVGSRRIVRTASGSDVGEGDLIVAAIDNGLVSRLEWVSADDRAHVLYVHVHGGEAVIGPECVPDRPGCLWCWAARYYSRRPEAHRWLRNADAGTADQPDPWLTSLSASIVGQLAAVTATDILRRDVDRPPDACRFYSFNLRSLTGRRHTFLADSLCPRCGRRPLDARETAQPALAPRAKPRPDDDRVRDIGELSRVLVDEYISPATGIVGEVRELWRMTNVAVATTCVGLTDYTGVNHPTPCSGFCDRYSVSRPVAVLEGLERYASTRPRDRRFAVHDCLASLGPVAEDPRRFGWYGEREYAANAWLTRFDDDLRIDFAWGYSFRRQEPVLIPAQLVYYMEPSGGDPTCVIDSSVGCSVGSSPEEAMLHGILEVVERDAFLLAWYARVRLPRLDVMECPDPEVRAHCRRLQSEGYEVVALDATTDFGIPAIALIVRHREAIVPYAGCIAAAHHRPDRALRKAFRELIPGLRRYGAEARDEKREHARWLLGDPARVRSMEDHAYLYCLPEAAPALDFLTDTDAETSLDAMRQRGRDLCSSDLTSELRAVVARVLPAAHDVLVVDQTAPELRRGGVCCYKVLIPGAIPMTWGQHMRRLHGIPRLERALASMASRHPAPSGPEPNPDPHAFP